MVKIREHKEILEKIRLSLSKEQQEEMLKIEKLSQEREKQKKEEKRRRRKIYNNEVVSCDLCGERITRRNLKRHYSSINCRVGKENIELKKENACLLEKIREMESSRIMS